MASVTPIDVPILTWSRAEGNRLKTWFLGALTVLALVPFIGGVSYVAAGWICGPMTSHGIRGQVELLREEKTLQAARNMDAETRQDWERIIHDKRASMGGEASRASVYEVTVLLAILQGAGLGLLFWWIAASPTARLLVEAGASPAGSSELQAKVILDGVARTAGLSPPKLYVIQSSAPNAFAVCLASQECVLAVTRGLLQLLDNDELEAVFAHEMSHIGNQDAQLNTVVASLALFLRIPYLLFRRELEAGRRTQMKRRRNPWRMALSPMGVYILFVAPLLAAAIRAVVSRRREFLADADAVELTGTPRGLLRALAKMGGSGSTLPGANPAFAHFYFGSPAAGDHGFGSGLVATHPPMADRIQRLAALPGAPSVEELKGAIETGRRYAREHPTIEITAMAGVSDELASLNRGNPMGRVYRVMTTEMVPVYEIPSRNAPVLARVKPGALIVVFDDPGKMRQVNTAQQTFGYIERGVKLAAIDGVIPAEVYDPVARAAAENKLPPLGVRVTTHIVPTPRVKPQPQPLSLSQILAAAALGVAVFAGMFLALMKFGH